MAKVLICGRAVYGIIKDFLTTHLDQQWDVQVHDFCNPKDMLDLTSSFDPDVIVIVVGGVMAEDTASVTEVRERFPECPIIGVSLGMDEKYDIKPLMEAGATRILGAEEAIDLPEIIREITTSAVAAASD